MSNQFKIGDRVVAKNYNEEGENCFGTVLEIRDANVYAENWTVGSQKGTLPANLLELVSIRPQARPVKFKTGDRARCNPGYYCSGIKPGDLVEFNGEYMCKVLSNGKSLDSGGCHHTENFTPEGTIEFTPIPHIPPVQQTWPIEYKVEFIQPKNKKHSFMSQLSNYIKKTVDSNTQELLKAEFINGNLEPTSAGMAELSQIMWFVNIEALVARAKEINAENEKNNNK